MTYDKLVFWCNINLWKMQSENTNIELLRNTIDIFMDVTGYRFFVKEQFITFLLDIPWYDVYLIQASQYVFYNLFFIQKWSNIEMICCSKSWIYDIFWDPTILTKKNIGTNFRYFLGFRGNLKNQKSQPQKTNTKVAT